MARLDCRTDPRSVTTRVEAYEVVNGLRTKLDRVVACDTDEGWVEELGSAGGLVRRVGTFELIDKGTMLPYKEM